MTEFAAIRFSKATVSREAIRDTSAQDTSLGSSKRASNKTIIMLTLAIVAVTTAGVVSLSPWLGVERSAKRAQLRFSTVTREHFEREVAAQGVVVAAVSPRVYASSAGTVTLHVSAGDEVRTGDLIARIDSPELNNELQRESATLDSLETNLKRQSIDNKKLLLESQQVVDLATVRLTAAERELRRAELSWERKAISKQDLEKARDDATSAQIELGHARQKVTLDAEGLEFELETLRIERDRQRLAVANLERRIEELTVLAPVNGIVGTLNVDQRASILANAEIGTVVDLSALEIEVSVSDSYADDLAVGQPVRVRFGEDTYSGTLVSISPEISDSTVEGRVRFDSEQPVGLRQNQRLSTRIVLESKPDTMLVDSGAFYDSGSGRIIYRLNGDIAERVAIRTGSRSVGKVEILEGLNPGDRVIVSDIDRFEGSERVLLRD
ncbi:MAG: efflux RND transporter periplasmic adaptor subunit [Pseudomonadota bacterium]